MARKVSAVYNAKKKTAAATEETGADKLRRERVTALVTKAAEKSQKTVVESLSTLKVQITESLDTIGNQLTAELQSLKEVQEAITFEKETLKSLHDITAEANALETLLTSNEEERASFEREMEETRARWNEERLEHEKARKRDEEQYNYDLNRRRQKDQDDWTAKRRAEETVFQKTWDEKWTQLDAREAAVVAKEQELNDLRAQVANFEERLKKETSTAVAVACNALKKDLTHEHKVATMTFEGQVNLLKSEIATYQNRIGELLKVNTELQSKYAEATDKVQKIAEKAIEGASKQAPVFQIPTADVTNDKRR